MTVYPYVGTIKERLVSRVQLDFTAKALTFFQDDKIPANIRDYYLAFCEEVADTRPSPQSHPGRKWLQDDGFPGVFYMHRKARGRSDRIYFWCGRNVLHVLMVLEHKRRTPLEKGQLIQIKHALEEAMAKARAGMH